LPEVLEYLIYKLSQTKVWSNVIALGVKELLYPFYSYGKIGRVVERKCF
jgi:hypothetical protein